MATTTGGKQRLLFEPPSEPLSPITRILRTPKSRFEGLKDYDFRENFVTSRSHGRVRIHFVDEGPQESNRGTILLMHGEPSWSYLYRHMIPPLASAGFRVVAPDLVGFGKSDKPANRNDYSYERQVNWMSDFVVQTSLSNVTLFAQDWGGLIGLRLVARFPERFQRIVISNTALPLGGTGMNETFENWATKVSQEIPDWRMIMQVATNRELDDAELRAYEAPFPDESYKAATRIFPQLVPMYDAHASVEENRGAWRRVFLRWKKPLLTLFSDSDPVSRGGEKVWIQKVPGAHGQSHRIVRGGHFVQEDCPDVLVREILSFIDANPSDGAPRPRL